MTGSRQKIRLARNVLVISLNLAMEYSIPRSFIMTFATLSDAKEALKAQSSLLEPLGTDAFIEGAGREEGVGNDKVGQLEQPVQALRAQSPEVLAVALFAVPAVAAHLGEVYLSWYDHV